LFGAIVDVADGERDLCWRRIRQGLSS